MKRIDSRMLWGSLLIVAGLIILVHNFTGILDYFSEFIWAMLFIIGGGLFIYVFLSNREQWWAAIPGFTLLGIGTLIGLEWVWPAAASAVGGVLVTGGIAVAFLVIFLTHQEHWWAIIPGGSMMTISLMIVAEPLIGGDAVASLFFFGLSATFGLIYLLPTGGQRRVVQRRARITHIRRRSPAASRCHPGCPRARPVAKCFYRRPGASGRIQTGKRADSSRWLGQRICPAAWTWISGLSKTPEILRPAPAKPSAFNPG